MKTTIYARTGLRLEKGLHAFAVLTAKSRNQSFAAYIADLIALEASVNPFNDDLPDVRRIRGIVCTKTANLEDLLTAAEIAKEAAK